MKLTSAGRLTGVAAVLVIGVTAPDADTALSQISGDDFPAAALGVAHLSALGVACWALLVLLAGVTRVRLPGVPARLGALLFTTAIVASAASPAQAESTRDLEGLTLPDRPMIVIPVATVTVAPGDTLWGLAAEHLPDRSSAADIAESCARWYVTNRHVVGPDPDLIVPGQVLTPPPIDQDAS